jgi:hypothetical protein
MVHKNGNDLRLLYKILTIGVLHTLKELRIPVISFEAERKGLV